MAVLAPAGAVVSGLGGALNGSLVASGVDSPVNMVLRDHKRLTYVEMGLEAHTHYRGPPRNLQHASDRGAVR